MRAVATPTVLPFTLRFGHVLLEARINDRPVTLALDTGSGACAVDVGWAREQQLAGKGMAKAVGVDDVGVQLATLESLNLGHGVELRGEPAALVPLQHVSARHGRGIHGTIGFSFFSAHVVEIDYAGRVVRLHDPRSFVYDGAGERVPVDISKRVPILSAELVGRRGESMPARLLVDIGTGAYGGVLTKPFVDRHSTTLNEPPFIETVGAGVGGAVQVRLTALSALRIGGLTVQQPIVALPTTARGFFGLDWVDGTLGAAILSRTRLIVDYPHGEVIVEPIESWDRPFEYDLSGLSLHAIGPALESVIVDGVRPGSPAAAAAFEAGDVIRSVDGRVVSGDSLDWIAERLKVPNASYTFELERETRLIDARINLPGRLL